MSFNVGFIGSGGIARSHVFAINALNYYYDNVPKIKLCNVAASNVDNAKIFAKKFGFEKFSDTQSLLDNQEIDTLFILSPNMLHYEHLNSALDKHNIQNIYIEKPLCANYDQLQNLLNKFNRRKVNLQLGFQFLYMPAVLNALNRVHEIGEIIHFQSCYLHSEYLDKKYRNKRANRLVAAPEGGAVADLGSHVFSLLVAFLGNDLEIRHAQCSGSFDDVDKNSDLCSQVFVEDKHSGAIGFVVASRISSGASDVLELEIRGTRGAIQVSSLKPDILRIYKNLISKSNIWQEVFCGNDYVPYSTFPSINVPSGWLRSLTHALFVFFTGAKCAIRPTLDHGVYVQRLINDVAEKLKREIKG
ncbi:conserved hypothetical protein [Gammaproteobacteria bacterium]